MSRGTKKTDYLAPLKCYKKFGFADGFFRDAQEREDKELLPSPCGICKRSDLCNSITLDISKAITSEQILVVFGLNQIEGVTHRTIQDLCNEHGRELSDISNIKDAKDFFEQLGCTGKYGYATGFFFTDEIPLCSACFKEKECFKKFSDDNNTGKPLLEAYVSFIQAGANDRLTRK
jgi:hypothetical protein